MRPARRTPAAERWARGLFPPLRLTFPPTPTGTGALAAVLQQVRADYTDPDPEREEPDPNLVHLVEAASELLLLRDRVVQLVDAVVFRNQHWYRYCKVCGGGTGHLDGCELLPVLASLAGVAR